MKCGCKMTCQYDPFGQSEYNGEIVFCPLHASAEEMLEALKSFQHFIARSNENAGSTVDALIAKAQGKE